ncbi:MAG: 30S ribosomal protein S21 [Candidatus Rokuibacteriota bacterium]
MINSEIILQPGDGLDWALRRLKKSLDKAGVHADLKRHAHALSRGERRRLKHRLAIKKQRKTASREQTWPGRNGWEEAG